MEEIENKIKFGKLMGDIGRLQASRLDRYLEKIGLYRGQAILLVVLSDREGATHTEIAEKLRISPAAATKVIKRLEELNYLQRRPDPADERVSRVYLKEDGRAIIQEIKNIFRQTDRELLGIFTQTEREILTGYLQRMHAYLLQQACELDLPNDHHPLKSSMALHQGEKH
jgi:DNA-binding MarR family transcriptional regulator